LLVTAICTRAFVSTLSVSRATVRKVIRGQAPRPTAQREMFIDINCRGRLN
jgi:hypothetical protein